MQYYKVMNDDTIKIEITDTEPVTETNEVLERRAYTVKLYGALPVKPKYSSYEVYQTAIKTPDLLKAG